MIVQHITYNKYIHCHCATSVTMHHRLVNKVRRELLSAIFIYNPISKSVGKSLESLVITHFSLVGECCRASWVDDLDPVYGVVREVKGTRVGKRSRSSSRSESL